MDEYTASVDEKEIEGLGKEGALLNHVPQMTEMICSQIEDMVTSIKGNCELALRRLNDQGLVEECLTRVIRVVDRSVSLVRKLRVLCELSEDYLKILKSEG